MISKLDVLYEMAVKLDNKILLSAINLHKNNKLSYEDMLVSTIITLATDNRLLKELLIEAQGKSIEYIYVN